MSTMKTARADADAITFAPAAAARAIGVSRAAMYAAIRAGDVPHRRFGDRILIPAAWVETFGQIPPTKVKETA